MDIIVSEDFDGDGDDDFIAKVDVVDDSPDFGLMALRNDGGVLVDVTIEWLGASLFEDLLPNTDVSGLEVHDFNGDGAPDLSFAHAHIPIAQLSQFLLLNDGMGHFSPMPNADIDDPVNIIPFYTDYDADGDLDIVGYVPEVTEVSPGEYVGGGYEIVVLENTSNIKTPSQSGSTTNCPGPPKMNAGLNDAWYNPETDGQGFFITVFPDLGKVSMAWFTYDTELSSEDAQANLGDAGHRWITALGPIVGNSANMDIEIASGGIFDTATSIQRTDPPGSDGTITLTFDSCNSGTVEYDITSINRQGTVPIQRVAGDNIVICEALSTD
jgi:hypothetical protein